MIPASVLRVVVQAQGIAKTNAGLMSVHSNATRSATAAGGAAKATSTLGKTSAAAATGISKQAQAASVAATANGRVTASARAAGWATNAQTVASKAAAAAQATQAKAAHALAASSAAAGVVAGRAGKATKAGALTAGAGFVYAIDKAADFEEQLSSLESVADANVVQMGRLRQQAMDAGAATKFSALDAAKAQTELAKGGLLVEQIMGGGLDSALALAAAGEMDLAEAAETTANAMKLFGLEGRDSMKVADALATAANQTTADVSDFALALKMGGSVAKLAGLSFNDTVVVLEALAEAGIKGSDAGTSVKALFLNLTRDAPKAKKAMRELGVEIFDSQGNLKSLPAISANVRQAFGDLTKEQFLNKAGTIAGSDAIRTLWALYDAGPEKLRRLAGATAAHGTAAQVAATKQDNFRGKLENLQGSIETIAIAFGSKILPDLTSTAEQITDILSDPSIAGDEKLRRASQVFADLVEKGATEAISVAGDVGPQVIGALASSMAQSWTEMSPFAKLLTVAAIIRVVGGKGALVATGRTIGGMLGTGIGSGVATGIAAGASSAATAGIGSAVAGGAVSGAVTSKWGRDFQQTASGVFVPAGVAAGNAAGAATGSKFMSAMTGKVLPIARNVGLAGVGIALVDGVMREAGKRAQERSPDLMERLGAMADDSSFLGGPTWFGGDRGDANAQRMLDVMRQLQAGRSMLAQADINELARNAHKLDLTKQQRAEVQRTINLLNVGQSLGIKVDLDMDPSKLQQLDAGLQKLRAGVFTSTGDIAKVSRRNMAIVSSVLGRGTAEGRKAAAMNLRETARAFNLNMLRSGDVTKAGMARVRRLIREADLISPTRVKAREFGREWARGMDRSKEVTRDGTRQMIREAQRMPAPMRQVALQTWNHQITQARRGGKITKAEAQDMRSKVQSAFQGIELSSKRKSKNSADAVISNTARMVNQSSRGFDILGSNANSALRAFGVKDLQYEVRKFSPQGKQTGGFIVPGVGSGDKFNTTVPVGSFVMNREATKAYGLQRGGMAPVALEPGERVFYPNEVRRLGQSNLAAANAAVPRFGLQTGGFVELLHPFNDPAGHGGGNSHLHMAMLDVGRLVAIGRQLQRQGWLVGEHPAFGGLQGRHDPDGYHYSNQAIDVNWPDPSQEAAKIRALLANLGALAAGGVEGALDQVPKLILSGSEGPLRDLGQASIDKVRRAANSYLSRNAMVAGTGEMLGGASTSTKPGLMRLWRDAGGNPAAANVAAAVALAESGGNQYAKNVNSNGTIDRGYWQINSIHGALSTFDGLGNARAAVSISGNGTNWNPWVAYQKGLHAQYLQDGGLAALASGGVVGGDGASIADFDPMGLLTGGMAKKRKKGKGKKGKRTLRQRFASRLDKALGVVRKTGYKHKHRKAFKGVFKLIKGLGLDKPQRRLRELTDQADKYSEYAQNAASLSTTDADGNETPGLFAGKDQGHWLNAQLQALLDLRNKLVAVEERVVAKQAQAARLAEVAEKRLREVQKQIRGGTKHKHAVAGQIRTAEKALEAAEKHPKRNKGQITSLKARIKDLKGVESGIDKRQAVRTRVRDSLIGSGGVLKRIKDRQGDLGTLRGNILGQGGDGWKGLAAVQGMDGPTGHMSALPPIGKLGGEILAAQSALRELGAKVDVSGSTSGVQDSETVRLLQDQLKLANQRTAVSQSQYGILSDFQLPGFAGMFAQGGVIPKGMWGIAGETGRPEIVSGPATIYNPAHTQAMLAGGGGGERQIRVILEDRRTVIEDDGREVETIVHNALDKLVRRGGTTLPGGSRL